MELKELRVCIEEVPIEKALKVNIPEFDDYLKENYKQRKENKIVLVAYVSGEPAGYIIGYEENNSLYCWMVGVASEFRRRGIFKALFSRFEQTAKDRNYRKITIKTRNSRREMLSFLVKEEFDFVEVVNHPDDNRIKLEKEIMSSSA